jgi:hypothetical protein
MNQYSDVFFKIFPRGRTENKKGEKLFFFFFSFTEANDLQAVGWTLGIGPLSSLNIKVYFLRVRSFVR